MRNLAVALAVLLAFPAFAQDQGESPTPETASPGPGIGSPAPAAGAPPRATPADRAAAVAALEPAVNTSPRAASTALDRIDLGTKHDIERGAFRLAHADHCRSRPLERRTDVAIQSRDAARIVGRILEIDDTPYG